jgi:hypothetical protein
VPKHKPNAMNQEIKSEYRETLQSTGKGEDDEENSLCKYGAHPFDPWVSHHSIKNTFYKKKLNATESPMQMKYFDVLYLHTGHQEGTDFISNLNKRTDMKPFQFDSTFVLVNYHWKSVRKQFRLYLFYPYAIALFAVFWENNYFFRSDKTIGINYWFDKILAVIILCYSIITGAFEFIQIRERTSGADTFCQGLSDFFTEYLGDPWNVIDQLNLLSLLYVSLTSLIWSAE